MTIHSGRRIAYVTMLSMLALSIAGNVAHTFHLDPTPGVRSLVYAVAWPVMVWLGVELFVRVPWRPVLAHRLVRWVGILLVAAIAGLVSYRHLRGLLMADGEEWTVYTFGPLAVDGLMLMATLALLLTRALPDVEAAPKLTLAQKVAAARTTVLDVKAAAAGQAEVPAAEVPAALEPAPVTEVQDLEVPEPIRVPVDVVADPEEDLAPVSAPPATRVPRGTVDYAKATRLVQEDPKDASVAEVLGTSVKTPQRVRRAIRLMDTTTDLAAIASTVKLSLAAVTTIQKELSNR